MSIEGFPKSKSATSTNQTTLQGAQGTGASYNPPTGGSGVFGWLSGIYKEIVSGIKLKLGGSDVSASNPIPSHHYLVDSTGVYYFDAESLPSACTRNADGTIATFTYGPDPITGFSFRQTTTYVSGLFSSSTGWVKL